MVWHIFLPTLGLGDLSSYPGFLSSSSWVLKIISHFQSKISRRNIFTSCVWEMWPAGHFCELGTIWQPFGCLFARFPLVTLPMPLRANHIYICTFAASSWSSFSILFRALDRIEFDTNLISNWQLVRISDICFEFASFVRIHIASEFRWRHRDRSGRCAMQGESAMTS